MFFGLLAAQLLQCESISRRPPNVPHASLTRHATAASPQELHGHFVAGARLCRGFGPDASARAAPQPSSGCLVSLNSSECRA